MNTSRRSFVSKAIAAAAVVAVVGPDAAIAEQPQKQLGVHRWMRGERGDYYGTEFVRMFELKPGDVFYKFDEAANRYTENFEVASEPFMQPNGTWAVQAFTHSKAIS